jgi:hypothetical protein
MSEIKRIFDEISSTSSTLKKMEILESYKDNELLKEVLYKACSKRVKFYIKQIPEYQKLEGKVPATLDWGVNVLSDIVDRNVTGHDAINLLVEILESVSPEDAYIIERIIEKDCKIGMGTRNINKIFPNLIEKTPYMGAKSYDIKLVKKIFETNDVAFSQVKMDGRYCNAIIRGGEVELESRQGEPTILDGATFVEELKGFDDCVLNGELTMEGISRYESNGIVASIVDITKKREERGPEETAKKIAKFEKKHMPFQEALGRIKYTVWDTITVDEYYDNKSTVPYSVRLSNLQRMIEQYKPTLVKDVDTFIAVNYEEALEHFQNCLNKGEEGTILKAANGTWKDGKPNWQVKMKLEMDVDLIIRGFNMGTGKNSEVVSSLNCETSDGLLFTRPTGIKEDMMQYITENQDELLGTIVEVKCSGLSWDTDWNYSLLHPVFKLLRDDKGEANSLEEVKEIEAMAKGLK